MFSGARRGRGEISGGDTVQQPSAKRAATGIFTASEPTYTGDNINLVGTAGVLGGAAAAASPIEWRSTKVLLNKLLDATNQIAESSVQPALPESAVLQDADFPTTIITSTATPPLDASAASMLLESTGGGVDGIRFPAEATGDVPPFVTSDTLGTITSKVSSLSESTSTSDKITTFNKLLNAICTITSNSYFKTPKCSTLRRILADFIHDAHAHAKEYGVGAYMDTAMGPPSCADDLSALYNRLLTDTGINRPAKIHEELENIMKDMGSRYKGVLTASLSNNVVEDDISDPVKAAAFVGKLRTANIRYIIIDSQSGNPVCKIFASADGAESIFEILNTVASEADGASKLSTKKTGPVNIGIDDSLRDGVTLPVRNTFANRTHEISYEGGPKIVVKDGNKVPPNTIITLTGTAGFSINGLCNAVGAPFPRKGKSPKTITVTTGPGIGDLIKKPETLTIKPFTDLAQVYFAAVLYHVYGIKTVFVTMDSYCLYVAALFCLPVVMYAHPAGQRIYSFAKNVFQLSSNQVQAIHGNLLRFSGKTWGTFKTKIDAIRAYFWKIYNNTPFIVPFILASRVLSDIEQYERESMEKFKSIQEALTAFASGTASAQEKIQHIQNHAALASYGPAYIENYIFNDQQFLANVGDTMEELHSVLTKGKDSSQINLLGKSNWSDLKGVIDKTVGDLSTILIEYGIKEDHTELINLFIAQQLVNNTSMINSTDTPIGYEIYFKYWAVLMLLFGVAEEVMHIRDNWDVIKGEFTSTGTFNHITYTVPIRLYLNMGSVPVPNTSSTPLTISVSHIKEAVANLKTNHLTPLRRGGRVAVTSSASPDDIFRNLLTLIGRLSGEDSLFVSVSTTTSHEFYQFVECVQTIYSSPTASADAACSDIIKRVLTYIYNNIDAAYRGNADTVVAKHFAKNFNITMQHGGGDSDDESNEEELTAMLDTIRALITETDAAAKVYADASDSAHASIEESVDEAIRATQGHLNADIPASKEEVIQNLLDLLYSLRFDATESHEGVKYLAEYHNMIALLAQITDAADVRMVLRYYLVQNEWLSKYTSYLIPADVINGFLTAIDRLFVPPVAAATPVRGFSTYASIGPPPPVNTAAPSAAATLNETLIMGDDDDGGSLVSRTPPRVTKPHSGVFVTPTASLAQSLIPSPVTATPGDVTPPYPSVKPIGNRVGRKLFNGAAGAAANVNVTMGGGRRRKRHQTRRLRTRPKRRTHRRRTQSRQHKNDMPPAD